MTDDISARSRQAIEGRLMDEVMAAVASALITYDTEAAVEAIRDAIAPDYAALQRQVTEAEARAAQAEQERDDYREAFEEWQARAAQAEMRAKVEDQPGNPVAAPCAIEGCRYATLEAERDALRAENERLRRFEAEVKHATVRLDNSRLTPADVARLLAAETGGSR